MLLLVGVLSVALGAAWALLDDVQRGVEVGVCALLAGAPVGYALAARLPLRVAVRRGAAVDLRIDEAAARAAEEVTTVVLDKTGTVTTGDLVVVSVEPVEPDHDRNLRWFAAALEHAVDDPVGRAIARLAGRGHLTDVVHTPGVGVSGRVDRHPVRVGRPDWIGFDHPGGDGTTVAVEVDQRPLGHITVDDVVRDDAAASVERLRTLGLAPVLVSDGTGRNTERLARAAGIEEQHAEVAPEKRARLVTELQEAGRVVAVVGRTADNADALHAADLAVTDPGWPGRPALSVDTLDVGVVADVLALARSTQRVIRRNRVLGLVLPAFGLAAAGAGALTPVLALSYGVLATLVVVLGSMRAGVAPRS